MAAFSRWEVACGKARRYQDETGEELTKVALVEGRYLLPHFDGAGPWTHMATFDEIIREHIEREIDRGIANIESQSRRIFNLRQVGKVKVA